MKTLKFLGFVLGALTIISAASLNTSCSSSSGGDNNVSLTAAPESISDNGTDYTTFRVMFEDSDVTSQATITNITSNTPVSGTTFSSTTAGRYQFRATYNGENSNTVTVTVTGSSSDPDLELAVSPDQIINDGAEAATFTVTLDGNDVTSQATITNVTSGETVSDAKFTSTATGTFTFKAAYDGEESNTVTVTVLEEGQTEKFYQKVALFRFTSTGCSWCPNLDQLLQTVEGEQLPDKTTHMAIHVLFSTPVDPFYFAKYNSLMSQMGGVSSYPTCFVNLIKPGMSYNGQYKTRIENVLGDYPATTGIAVNSTIDGTTAQVEVKVKSTETRSYYLALAVLEDGLIANQASQSGTLTDYEHDNTLRSLYDDSLFGDNLGEIQNGQEITKTYTLDLSKCEDLSNCKLMIYTVNTFAGHRMVNNSIYADLDGETPYRYAE